MKYLLPLLCAGMLHAEVPNIINYQGQVQVKGSAFSGAGKFKFALIRQASASHKHLPDLGKSYDTLGIFTLFDPVGG